MLDDTQITTITNHFVRLMQQYGLHTGVGANIALIRYDDGWGLEILQARDSRLKDASVKFPYPEFTTKNDNVMDLSLELAGYISHKLHNWSKLSKQNSKAGKISSNRLTPEQRRERAKKAVAARMAKYGQKRRNV